MLYFDARDERGGLQAQWRLRWLTDLGAQPIHKATLNAQGYVFAGDRGIQDYLELLSHQASLKDRAEARRDLQDLSSVLDRVVSLGIPTPRTWRLELDAQLPDDLQFPLFVRTARTSWKLGGGVSRVQTILQLQEECQELRHAFGWNSTILARQWIEFESAGTWRRGDLPVEVRVWIVDRKPAAWSFHHLHVVARPRGFPPSMSDLELLERYARHIGRAFDSRLIVADFARDKKGAWWLVEADNGSPAGTAHEAVFKSVAERLDGRPVRRFSDTVGGTMDLLESDP